MILYHGTTQEALASLRQHGLRKGAWCSPDRGVAEHFAASRAEWNGQEAVVLEVEAGKKDVALERRDCSGRPEVQLATAVRRWRVS